MKRRISKIVNFVVFNLLFFALYLNFIHKDQASPIDQVTQANPTNFTGTVLVESPVKRTSNVSEATNEFILGHNEKPNQAQLHVSTKHTTN